MAKEEFSPKVYNFTLSQEFADSAVCWDLNSYKVESPSFNILFDHTIAVIWHVFNKDGAELYCLNRAGLCGLFDSRFIKLKSSFHFRHFLGFAILGSHRHVTHFRHYRSGRSHWLLSQNCRVSLRPWRRKFDWGREQDSLQLNLPWKRVVIGTWRISQLCRCEGRNGSWDEEAKADTCPYVHRSRDSRAFEEIESANYVNVRC